MSVQAVLPWVLSALTIASNWLAGSKRPEAWTVALINTALWLWYIIVTETWGLLPMNAALWVVYSRNALRWGEKPS